MYFGNEYLGDAIYEQTILNEIHISKKDLKDPKVLEKVLEKTKKDVETHNNIVMSLSFAIGIAGDIVLGVVTGSILVPIITFVPFIIGVLVAAMKFLKTEEAEKEKNIQKLIDKVEKLKKETEKLEDSEEKKKILSTCDEILDSIKKYNKSESDRIVAEYNAKIDNWYKNPKSIWEDADLLVGVIKKYKMTNEDFIKFVDKNKNNFTKISIKNQAFGIDEDDNPIDDVGYSKYCKKFGKNSDDVYDIFGNDEYGLVFEPKSKSLIEYCLPNYINFKVNMKTWNNERVMNLRFGK